MAEPPLATEELPEPQLDSEHIDAHALLSKLFHRFQAKKGAYECLARSYLYLDLFIFTIPLLLAQSAAAASYKYLGKETMENLSVCLSAFTTIWLAIQIKLRWGATSQACKQAGLSYGVLAGETYYRLRAVECGGNLTSILDFWKFSLHWERRIKSNDLPSIPRWLSRRYSNRKEEPLLKIYQPSETHV